MKLNTLECLVIELNKKRLSFCVHLNLCLNVQQMLSWKRATWLRLVIRRESIYFQAYGSASQILISSTL